MTLNTAVKGREARTIKLISVLDPHQRAKKDGGNDKNGNWTSSRRQLAHVLGKKVEVNGKKVALFMLAEAPTQIYSDEDQFDATLLKNRADGEWLLPSKEWLALRDKQIKDEAERRNSRMERLAAVDANNVVRGLANISSQLAQAAPKDAAQAAPKGKG